MPLTVFNYFTSHPRIDQRLQELCHSESITQDFQTAYRAERDIYQGSSGDDEVKDANQAAEEIVNRLMNNVVVGPEQQPAGNPQVRNDGGGNSNVYMKELGPSDGTSNPTLRIYYLAERGDSLNRVIPLAIGVRNADNNNHTDLYWGRVPELGLYVTGKTISHDGLEVEPGAVAGNGDGQVPGVSFPDSDEAGILCTAWGQELSNTDLFEGEDAAVARDVVRALLTKACANIGVLDCGRNFVVHKQKREVGSIKMVSDDNNHVLFWVFAHGQVYLLAFGLALGGGGGGPARYHIFYAGKLGNESPYLRNVDVHRNGEPELRAISSDNHRIAWINRKGPNAEAQIRSWIKEGLGIDHVNRQSRLLTGMKNYGLHSKSDVQVKNAFKRDETSRQTILHSSKGSSADVGSDDALTIFFYAETDPYNSDASAYGIISVGRHASSKSGKPTYLTDAKFRQASNTIGWDSKRVYVDGSDAT